MEIFKNGTYVSLRGILSKKENAKEGIWILLTVNSMPDMGGYKFDDWLMSDPDDPADPYDGLDVLAECIMSTEIYGSKEAAEKACRYSGNFSGMKNFKLAVIKTKPFMFNIKGHKFAKDEIGFNPRLNYIGHMFLRLFYEKILYNSTQDEYINASGIVTKYSQDGDWIIFRKLNMLCKIDSDEPYGGSEFNFKIRADEFKKAGIRPHNGISFRGVPYAYKMKDSSIDFSLKNCKEICVVEECCNIKREEIQDYKIYSAICEVCPFANFCDKQSCIGKEYRDEMFVNMKHSIEAAAETRI